MMKIGIVTTHPIQYQVPWFRLLAAEPGIDLTVFFAMIPDERQQGDGFGVGFQWDIPLLSGYAYRVLKNVAAQPSVSRFFGCDTPEIDDIVRTGGFDAFIVNGWVAKSCIQLLRACNRYGVPCIVRGESNALRPRTWWKRAIHRILLRRYSAFLYIGEANKRFYQNGGVPAATLFFAPYCVENERFATAAAELQGRRAELRAGWGIPADAVVYLFCGKFIAKKHPLDCLRALQLAQCETTGTGTPIHLLMVGSGELLDECRSYAAEHRSPVTFAGFLNQGEISRAYVASDCLLLPSDDGETWGLVVNEAMASSLPAIVSDRVGCHPDLVIPGETGLVFPFGDVARMAECMSALGSDPKRLASMGNAARTHVAGYNYSEVVRGTVAALSQVCAKSPSPAEVAQ